MASGYRHKRIAIKIGSNVLVRRDGTIDTDRMSALVDEIAGLKKDGLEIILIQVDFTTSASIKHSTWLPEHLYNGQEVILTRQSGSTQWQLRQIGGQPV